jgi:hypothetical protein
MPTIHREGGMEFYFYINDHNSAHLHVEKDDNGAKILIETCEVVYSDLKPKDLKRALEIVEQNKSLFLLKFREYTKK